jgi:flagellar biosynthesis component FlhA
VVSSVVALVALLFLKKRDKEQFPSLLLFLTTFLRPYEKLLGKASLLPD